MNKVTNECVPRLRIEAFPFRNRLCRQLWPAPIDWNINVLCHLGLPFGLPPQLCPELCPELPLGLWLGLPFLFLLIFGRLQGFPVGCLFLFLSLWKDSCLFLWKDLCLEMDL